MISPMPVVVMKTPPHCPFPATFVSPATSRTPASSAVFAIASAIWSSSSIRNPSSMTKAQVIYSGRAPMQERSLTVPQMLSFPMLPPGKNCGDTMKPSVVIASRPHTGGSTAASSAVKYSLPRCFSKIPWISSDVCFPPAPCAIVIVSVILAPFIRGFGFSQILPVQIPGGAGAFR